MPKLLYARPPANAEEEWRTRKLAGSRHAPGDWTMRAKMIVASWDGERTSTIAAQLGCHMQTVREHLARFNAEGLDGLGDRTGAGRKRRITERQRGRLIALARANPPGGCTDGDLLALVPDGWPQRARTWPNARRQPRAEPRSSESTGNGGRRVLGQEWIE
ncbi:helix-turn-helix domain-containing protein [Parafrankia sp. BMG5.11]|uniref:helix-turn-helix domain-containing protein n=2 Tax=unclassified Parafrankia TaxID=2994368 RepID=UPI000DA4273F